MSTPSETRLEAAVLVDSEYVEQWQRNALVELVTEVDVEITTVVVNDRDTDTDPGRGPWSFLWAASERVRTYPLWSLVGVARLLAATPDYERLVPIDSVAGVSDTEWISCSAECTDGHWSTLPEDAVEQVAETDIVVRFGFGMIKGDVLDAPTYGVLSYHMGDIREYRGQPGGFWEFCNGENRMGVTVQRLTDTLDGGEIAALERFDIEEANTWQEVWTRAHHRADGMLVPAVRALVEPDQSVTRPDDIGTLYSMPEGSDVLRYVAKNTRGRLRNRLERSDEAWRPPAPHLLLLAGVVLLAVGVVRAVAGGTESTAPSGVIQRASRCP